MNSINNINIFLYDDILIKCIYNNEFTIIFYNLINKNILSKINECINDGIETNIGIIDHENFKYDIINNNDPQYYDIIKKIKSNILKPYIDFNDIFKEKHAYDESNTIYSDDINDIIYTLCNDTNKLIEENKNYSNEITELVYFDD